MASKPPFFKNLCNTTFLLPGCQFLPSPPTPGNEAAWEAAEIHGTEGQKETPWGFSLLGPHLSWEPDGRHAALLVTWETRRGVGDLSTLNHSTPEPVAEAARLGCAPAWQPQPNQALLWGQKEIQARHGKRLFPPTVALSICFPRSPALPAPCSSLSPVSSAPTAFCRAASTPPVGQPKHRICSRSPSVWLPKPFTAPSWPLQLLVATYLQVHLSQSSWPTPVTVLVLTSRTPSFPTHPLTSASRCRVLLSPLPNVEYCSAPGALGCPIRLPPTSFLAATSNTVQITGPGPVPPEAFSRPWVLFLSLQYQEGEAVPAPGRPRCILEEASTIH